MHLGLPINDDTTAVSNAKVDEGLLVIDHPWQLFVRSCRHKRTMSMATFGLGDGLVVVKEQAANRLVRHKHIQSRPKVQRREKSAE